MIKQARQWMTAAILVICGANVFTACTSNDDNTTPQPSDVWDAETGTLYVNSNPGKSAYEGRTDIVSVVFSDGVTSIGSDAGAAASGNLTHRWTYVGDYINCSSYAVSSNLNFGGETTGIISVNGSGFRVNGSDGWYSLDGRRLDGKPSRAGVYINKGIKVVVK